MTVDNGSISRFNSLNLWDLEVRSVRLYQSDEPGLPTYDLEIETEIRAGTLGPDTPSAAAWLRFRNCAELGAMIDVLKWVILGPELTTQCAALDATDPSLARYTLNLRAPGGQIEVVAHSFSYEGPDITTQPMRPEQNQNWTWNELQAKFAKRNTPRE